VKAWENRLKLLCLTQLFASLFFVPLGILELVFSAGSFRFSLNAVLFSELPCKLEQSKMVRPPLSFFSTLPLFVEGSLLFFVRFWGETLGHLFLSICFAPSVPPPSEFSGWK